jgi:hypothetical protein
MIDGIFYDAFNYGYDIPEVTPFGLQVCVCVCVYVCVCACAHV